MKEIKLSQGKVALVDDEDYEYLKLTKWTAHRVYKNKYRAVRSYYLGHDVRRTLPMHRAIMNPPDNMEVDHIDGNPLNNQRSNLRICTHHQNLMNQPAQGRLGVLGVTRSRGKYSAQIKFNGVHMNLGTYTTIEDAAKRYDQAAKKYFGEFANLNYKENVAV